MEILLNIILSIVTQTIMFFILYNATILGYKRALNEAINLADEAINSTKEAIAYAKGKEK